MFNQGRQGDVFLVKSIAPIPANAVRARAVDGRFVLAYGESTGHAHTVLATRCQLYDLPDGGMLLEVIEPARVQHQEHGDFVVAPGTSGGIEHREYEYGKARRVAD